MVEKESQKNNSEFFCDVHIHKDEIIITSEAKESVIEVVE